MFALFNDLVDFYIIEFRQFLLFCVDCRVVTMLGVMAATVVLAWSQDSPPTPQKLLLSLLRVPRLLGWVEPAKMSPARPAGPAGRARTRPVMWTRPLSWRWRGLNL